MQLPVDLPLGSASLTVTVGGQTSAPINITIAAYAPAFVNEFGAVCIDQYSSTLAPIAATNPATPGHILDCTLVGLGSTNPVVQVGGHGPAATASLPTVMIGAENAPLVVSELVDPSIYQVQFLVPYDAPKGNLTLIATIGGVSAPAFSLPVGVGPPAVTGTTLFSNLGSSYGYSRSSINGLAIGGSRNQVEAMAFIPGNDATFTGARIALSGSGQATVYLEADNNGVPGSIIEQINVAGLEAGLVSPVMAASVLKPSLAAGARYWLVVTQVGSQPFVNIWLFDTTGDISNGSNSAGNTSGSPTGPWNLAPGAAVFVVTRGAFEILGVPTGSPPANCTNTAVPAISSIDSASAYGGYSYFASGSWLEIKGSNLANPSDPRLTAVTNPGQWTSSDFNGVYAPTSLDGVSVRINSLPAYVWYISPTQLNVQAPEDSSVGTVTITASNCIGTSGPITFTKKALAPGLLAPSNYSSGGTQYLVATFASDGAYVLSKALGASFGLTSRAAKPGDLIVAYGVGLGDVTPATLPGVIVGQTNALANPVTFSFGSSPATLSYAGLAGNFVGLYEFFITVPSGLADGDYPIKVTQNGNQLPQTFYLTVQN